MSIGPTVGIAASVAGAPLAQNRVSEPARAETSAAQSRQADSAELAEQAAGVGSTHEDQQANDRDADGRRLWEEVERKRHDTEEEAPPAAERRARDASHTSGNQLDLSG